MSKAVFLTAISLLIVGCVSHPMIKQTSYEQGSNPAMGIMSEADVGSVIYEEFRFQATETAYLLETIEEGFSLGDLTAIAGTSLPAYRGDNGVQYCSDERLYSDPLVGPYSIACFSDLDRDGHFDRVRVPSIKFGAWSKLDKPVAYRIAVTPATPDGIKNELIYQGIDRGTLRLAYREFMDNFIRPAYQQDVTYQMTEAGPTFIRFRGVEIEVLEANNQGITYRVLAGFTK